MLKRIYDYFAAKVRHQMIHELIDTIPSNIRNPALRVTADNKYKVERMLMFMAYELHRKMIYDRKNSQLYEGQLIQIKLFLMMMEVAIAENKPPEVAQKEDVEFVKATKGMNRFRELINRKKD
jgi:hypothetical protein